MDENKYMEIMDETVKSIKDLLDKRLNNRIDALQAISSSPMDSVPEAVQKMREEEAAKIRAVIQEQRDIIDIIKSLFPNA